MRRLLALLVCAFVFVLCREAIAEPAGSGTLTIWPVPALALTPGLLSGIVMAIAAPDATAPPASPAIVGFATPTSAGAALTTTF